MRNDLVRFGNILFLDAQKKQYNEVGWPYIGPCVRDSEMKTRTIAQCICIQENHDMYCWILNSVCKMEPKFSLSDINFICGDQHIKSNILSLLKIKDSCLLRCDFYHHMNEVWPKKFSLFNYKKIKQYLKMILAGNQQQWELTICECQHI